MIPVALTKEYYSKWIGADAHLLDETGVFFVYNPLRDQTPAGYQEAFDVYTFISPSTIIISYGDKAKQAIHAIENRFTPAMSMEEIQQILSGTFHSTLRHDIKYIFSNVIISRENAARKLTRNDCEKYHAFFIKANPHCQDISWIEEYFNKNTDRGYCHGVFIKDTLISATDSPQMPYMAD